MKTNLKTKLSVAVLASSAMLSLLAVASPAHAAGRPNPDRTEVHVIENADGSLIVMGRIRMEDRFGYGIKTDTEIEADRLDKIKALQDKAAEAATEKAGN